MDWPERPDDLVTLQKTLAAALPEPWRIPTDPITVGGCFVCFERGGSGSGATGDRGWAGAALIERGRAAKIGVVEGAARAPYQAGLLALREGRLLEAAVWGLERLPDVLMVNATGRDHPRRAGLALQLGAVLGVPTVGVTHRPLVASGEWPGVELGATSPLRLDGEVVGYWLRTKPDARPLAVHAAWRIDAATAVQVVRMALGRGRTPEPIALARQAARLGRAQASAGPIER